MTIIRPVGARVLIKVQTAASKSTSGLYLDNSTNNSAAPVKGEVLEAGAKSQFSKGDIIYYRRYSTDDLKIVEADGEKTVTFVDDEDIIGIQLTAN